MHAASPSIAVWKSSRIAVVIPCFNVASRIERVLRTMPSWVDLLVAIDDGSTDETPSVLSELASSEPRLQVVTHEQNRGVGAALCTGYRAALRAEADVLVVMAGDGQMDPEDLAALVTPVVSGTADYAKGNRLRHREVVRAMPWTRLAGNVVLSGMTRAATGLWHVGDSQCGYTAMHRRVLERLAPEAMWARYGYPNHLLGALASAGFRVVDVTVRPVYAGEQSGVKVRDAVLVIPGILARVAWARWQARRGLPAPEGFALLASRRP